MRLDGEIKHSYDGMRAINFEVPLFAADPFLYGEPIVYQAFPAGSGVGLRYPLYAAEPKGALFYGQQAPRYVGATNEGNATAHPTYTIQGEWSSGVRITSNDGKVIEYPYPITTTSPITIDCARGACLIEGRDASNRLSARQWHTIPPRRDVYKRQRQDLKTTLDRIEKSTVGKIRIAPILDREALARIQASLSRLSAKVTVNADVTRAAQRLAETARDRKSKIEAEVHESGSLARINKLFQNRNIVVTADADTGRAHRALTALTRAIRATVNACLLYTSSHIPPQAIY